LLSASPPQASCLPLKGSVRLVRQNEAMSETTFITDERVLIALISAGSAVVGSLFGAISAVLGPWWLKRLEIKTDREARYLEARRLAIVQFANSKLDSMQQYNQSMLSGVKSENLALAFGEANKRATELYSLISKKDSSVKSWINGMSFKAFTLKPSNIEELCRADSFLGVGIQHLLSWHIGEIHSAGLRPFGLDKSGNSIWLSDWDQPWPE